MNLDERLKDIEKRLDSITSSKWIYVNEDENEDHYICTSDGRYIAQTTYDTLSSSKKHNVVEDSLFIANAPEDISFLLSLVKELKK